MIAQPRPAQVARFVADFTRGFAAVVAGVLLLCIMVTWP
jgi:hypothetical protein